MKFLLYIFSLHCFYFLIVIECVKVDLLKEFPIYEEEKYIINFVTETKHLPIYTVILFQCYQKDALVEHLVLNPGYLKGLPKPIYADYFSVLNYETKPKLVKVILQFKRLSNNADLKVIYNESNTASERTEILRNNKLQSLHNVITVRISLVLRWALSLIQRTWDHREGGLVVGSVGLLVCKATDGSPYSAATIGGVNNFHEIRKYSKVATEQNNEAIFAFQPTIKDHMKKIKCKADPDEIDGFITIFHHPTKIDTVPPNNGFVENGTTILCQATDGFPVPKSKWALLKGPTHAELYYSIKGDSNILHMKRNSPLGSRWSFKCSSTNTIPNSLNGGVDKVVDFVIGVKPVPVTLIVFLISALLILACVIAIIVICYRSGKCHRTKEALIPTSGQEQDIFFYPSDKCIQDKKPLTNSSGNSTTTRNSHNGSINSACKEGSLKGNNPIDLV